MIVIADTTPLNYLVLIDQPHLLPQLYGRVLIPQAVYDELGKSALPPQCEPG
jgi:predicted nucleic acid-binding protein